MGDNIADANKGTGGIDVELGGADSPKRAAVDRLAGTVGEVAIVERPVVHFTVEDTGASHIQFGGVCKGTGRWFVAQEFGDTVTAESQWLPSPPPALPMVLRVQ